MVKKAEEMEREIKEQMRGGKGSVTITHILRQDELTGKARLCARITLNPGCSIGLHQHMEEEEIFYILQGKGIVNDNGTQREVETGDAILTGGGASHAVECIGEQPLEMVAVILLYA